MSRILNVAVFFLIFFSFAFVSLFAQKAVSAPQREIREHLARAQQAMADKQLDSALHEFTAILALDPNNVEARGDLGVVQYLAGNYAEASQNLRAALRLQPALWKAQAILGLCERAQGRFDSARTLLAKSFPHLQDPKLQIRAGMALAELDYQWRDLEKASAVLAVLQKLDPANVDVLYVIYRVHTDLATQARDNLALIAPNSARMHQVLAQHLFTEGDAKGAVAQYREAVRIDPHLPGAHFELGEAILQDSMSEGSQQNAQKEFETALAINPSDAKAEAQLGALFSLHGDVAAALSHYQRAAELSPDDPEAQVGLGKVLMSTGEPEKALQHLLAAVRIDPTNAQAHYRLAQLYRQLARASDAEREMGTFLELRQGEERLRSAYSQIYRQSGNSQALNPDIPQ
jgi:tetratricopeptide (TPR) repeat protein